MNKNFITSKSKSDLNCYKEWRLTEGVIKSPNGKYIARVVKVGGRGKVFNTISQHDTEEEALKAYNDYYKNAQNDAFTRENT